MEKEVVEELLNTCGSFAEVLKKLGRKPSGGNYRLLKRFMEENNILEPQYKVTREEYEKNPKHCLNCGKEIDFEHRYNKYCSKSCAAEVNNKLYPKKKKGNVNKHERKYPEDRVYKEENQNYCVVCGNKLKGNQKKFCSKYCKTKFYSGIKYHTNYSAKQDEEGTKIKYRYILKMGGKCSVCGYDKNLSALTFHHVNPEEKEFTLTSRAFNRTTEETIEKELNKCVLLCQNCHHEIHHPELDKEKIGKL